MRSSTREALASLLARRRHDVVEYATDWVFRQAVDLGRSRAREQTRALVERVIVTQTSLLLEGERGPLDEFVEYVTSLRASGEFHVSTLLRGFFSFRASIAALAPEELPIDLAYELLEFVDAVAQRAALQVADVYTEKLNHTIVLRRDELERELDEKLRTIDAQRRALDALSSPLIDVWHGIFVVPLIGDVREDRAAVVSESVLEHIASTRAHTVIIDITGVTVTSESLGESLVRLFGAVHMLGAHGMLVGVSPRGAIALSKLDLSLEHVGSYPTLHDGLRAAFARRGLTVVDGERGHGPRDGRSARLTS